MDMNKPMKNPGETTRTVILGTDWWTDCDDVAALRILCRGDKLGWWKVAGVVCNAMMDHSAASLNAYLTTEGYGELPIGLDKAATDYGGNPPYQKRLTELPHRIAGNDDPAVEDGLALYLRLLREAEGPVEILEIGYPQVLAALCEDPEGYKLLEEKVTHIWMMAGNWEKEGVGSENNINRAPRSRKAAATLFENCPCPITFLGWEVGATVLSGKPHPVRMPLTDPLRIAFMAHGSMDGRSSWDPMLVLLALIEDPAEAGYTVRYGYASADAETGENRFRYDENGPHRYVVKTQPDDWYEDQLAAWLGKME